jgi:starch synthase (maltosyl-transferring)
MPGQRTHGARARRLLSFDPLRAGAFDRWSALLDGARELGFDAVLLPPPFAAPDGEPTLALDHARAPRWLDDGDATRALARVASACRQAGLALFVDLVVDRVALGGALHAERPDWFVARAAPDADPPDPRRGGPERGTATIRWHVPAVAEAATEWFRSRIAEWLGAGVAGFRCLDPGRVPPHAWRDMVLAARRHAPRAQFLAWTPGLTAEAVAGLAGCGFDATFLSLPWWNYRDAWLVEEHVRLAAVAPPIGIVATCAGAGPHVSRTRALRALWAAAALGNGVLVPHGFERDADGAIEPVVARDVKAANTLAASLGRTACRLRAATGPDAPLTVIAREAVGDGACLVVVNPAEDRLGSVDAGTVLAHVAAPSARFAALHPRRADPLTPAAAIVLEPGAVHVYEADNLPAVRLAAPDVATATGAPRIAIDDVSPSVDGGRYAAKRVVGERVRVEADVYADGHGQLGVELVWRRADEDTWQRVRMASLGNDRWGADFPLERLGRHEFLVEAWQDRFATFRGDLEMKQAAGVDSAVELADAAVLLEETFATTEGVSRAALSLLLDAYRKATPDAQLALLLAPETAKLLATVDPRPFRVVSATHPVDAERLIARFASWYELFPRSQSGDVHRHGTLDDVIAQLPRIREMGFDVLYMPPIHPIGARNRKGRNNSLVAQPGDPGSPYAIGSADGGHDALHPALGTLAEFQRLVAAAAAHGLEVALDFAIQCSPDHPWLAQHPEWFAWRADGTIRYAENPPKKYEDIVNVDFHAPGAMPSLWLALRDVVLFWVAQGVRLFRVDNPHTKPFPFWEWLIADVRARDPGVVFLAEAFTRPNPMYRLAKLGFSQSYTYFTWRNTKSELTSYLEELADTDVREYYRPHFFVNTPDINPFFLQRSGRAGFLIRAALATTLSGLWGMYQGFELCEAAAVPGKEEYLDSEKYELRAWDHERAGNIVAEVTRLNRIRRANPALQRHTGVRFHAADNEQVLFFSKRTPALDNVVLVAVSLDPHEPQEATLDLPLHELGLPEHGAYAVADLLHERALEWRGARQRVRLDPGAPYAIWRIAAGSRT